MPRILAKPRSKKVLDTTLRLISDNDGQPRPSPVARGSPRTEVAPPRPQNAVAVSLACPPIIVAVTAARGSAVLVPRLPEDQPVLARRRGLSLMAHRRLTRRVAAACCQGGFCGVRP